MSNFLSVLLVSCRCTLNRYNGFIQSVKSLNLLKISRNKQKETERKDRKDGKRPEVVMSQSEKSWHSPLDPPCLLSEVTVSLRSGESFDSVFSRQGQVCLSRLPSHFSVSITVDVGDLLSLGLKTPRVVLPSLYSLSGSSVDRVKTRVGIILSPPDLYDRRTLVAFPVPLYPSVIVVGSQTRDQDEVSKTVDVYV